MDEPTTTGRYTEVFASETEHDGGGDRALTGLPLAIMEMREALHRLHAEIGMLTEQAGDVLLPDNPAPSPVSEIIGRPMSPATGELAQLQHEIHRATLRVAELSSRLDL